MYSNCKVLCYRPTLLTKKSVECKRVAGYSDWKVDYEPSPFFTFHVCVRDRHIAIDPSTRSSSTTIQNVVTGIKTPRNVVDMHSLSEKTQLPQIHPSTNQQNSAKTAKRE